MNTPTPIVHSTEDRLSALERSSARWRIVAISSITLFAGVLIGGMGTQTNQPNTTDPKAIIGVAGTADAVYRVHQDGSLTYIRIPKGERTAEGYYNWGDIKIDATRKSRDLPQ
jgi:hypothetical protein